MKITTTTPPKEILAELGRRLRTVRRQRGLSQSDLSDAAGLTRLTLGRIENGHDAQFETWIKTLQALGMTGSLDALLPEDYRSPMADVKAERARSRRPDGPAFTWGDETP